MLPGTKNEAFTRSNSAHSLPTFADIFEMSHIKLKIEIELNS